MPPEEENAVIEPAVETVQEETSVVETDAVEIEEPELDLEYSLLSESDFKYIEQFDEEPVVEKGNEELSELKNELKELKDLIRQTKKEELETKSTD
jgi:hypothetical protein